MAAADGPHDGQVRHDAGRALGIAEGYAPTASRPEHVVAHDGSRTARNYQNCWGGDEGDGAVRKPEVYADAAYVMP